MLVTPTYGGGEGRGVEKGAVPKQVIGFLNDERQPAPHPRRDLTGNTNFGEGFCLAGDIVAASAGCPTSIGSRSSARQTMLIA